MRYIISVIIVCFLSAIAVSQSDSTKTKKRKGTLYFAAGYTRVWFSKSDLHLVDRSNKYHPATGQYNNYDFTVYGVEAEDRNNFEKIPDIANFTVPQYAYRIGYFFNNKSDLGVEINYDHTKYIVKDYQKVRVKGDINGTYIDKDTVVDPKKFLHFEHSDGANYLLFNFVKRWKLVKNIKNFDAGWVAKAGIGMVIPRTDVTLFGERLNNDFHIAGYLGGIETGIRAEFYKYAFFEFVGKVCYANYVNSLVLGKGNGRAYHQFYSYQLSATLGVQMPFLKLK